MHTQNISINTEKLENQEKLSPSGCKNQPVVINVFKILEAKSWLREGLS